MNDEYLEKSLAMLKFIIKLFVTSSIPSMAHTEIYTVHFIYQLIQFIW